MSKTHRIPAKALSFLLSLLMLLSCVSMGFTALAVEDSYAVLAQAMREDGMRGVIPSYKASSSPSTKGKLTASDPKASSAVYVQSAEMWAAMNSFWKIAKSLKSKDLGDIVVGDNGNILEGWTGELNTARKIASEIAAQLVARGHMTSEELNSLNVLDTFNWFIGGYTAEHSLLDSPVRGDKPALQPWSLQVFGSTGYFGATRTRDQALLSGPTNFNDLPAKLELNRRWDWAHEPRRAANGAGNARQYWHVLSTMDSQENVVDTNGLAFDPAQADTKPLKKVLSDWKSTFSDAFLNRDLSDLSTEELLEIKAVVAKRIDAAKDLQITNTLLYYYGLKTYIDVGVLQRNLEYHLELAPYRPYVNFFNEEASTKGQLKRMSTTELNEEVLQARMGLEVLDYISKNNKNVYNGLINENDLDLARAEEYFGEVLNAISAGQGVTELVALIAGVINEATYKDAAGNLQLRPRLAVNVACTVTDPDNGSEKIGPAVSDDYLVRTAADLYDLYQQLAMANAALTGSIGGTLNFPSTGDPAVPAVNGTTVAHGLPYEAAVPMALNVLLKAINEKDPIYAHQYAADSTVPTGGAAWNDTLIGVGGTPAAGTAYDDNWPASASDAIIVLPQERFPTEFESANPAPAYPGGTAPTAPAYPGASNAAYAAEAQSFIASVPMLTLIGAVNDQLIKGYVNLGSISELVNDPSYTGPAPIPQIPVLKAAPNLTNPGADPSANRPVQGTSPAESDADYAARLSNYININLYALFAALVEQGLMNESDKPARGNYATDALFIAAAETFITNVLAQYGTASTNYNTALPGYASALNTWITGVIAAYAPALANYNAYDTNAATGVYFTDDTLKDPGAAVPAFTATAPAAPNRADTATYPTDAAYIAAAQAYLATINGYVTTVEGHATSINATNRADMWDAFAADSTVTPPTQPVYGGPSAPDPSLYGPPHGGGEAYPDPATAEAAHAADLAAYIAARAAYANSLVVYFGDVQTEYATAKDHYDRWSTVANWIKEYETKWLGGLAVADRPATGWPNRSDTAYQLDSATPAGPHADQAAADAAYTAAATTYISALNGNAARKNFLDGLLGIKAPLRSDYATTDPDGAGPLSAYPTQAAADAAYAATAQSYFLRIEGLLAEPDNFAPNNKYPTAAAPPATLMQTKYNYLKNLEMKLGAKDLYEEQLRNDLTVAEFAYKNLITKQRLYNEALRGTDQAAINKARAELRTAAINYTSRWEGADTTKPDPDAPPATIPGQDGILDETGFFIRTGTSPNYIYTRATYGLKPANLELRGYTGAVTSFSAELDKVTGLQKYRLFFNPYRLSMAGALGIAVGEGALPSPFGTIDQADPNDWNKYSDADLREELAAALEALEGFKNTPAPIGSATVTGTPPTEVITPGTAPDSWEMYVGRTDGNGKYDAGEDTQSVRGVIRGRIEQLLAGIDPSKPISAYTEVMTDDGKFSVDSTTGEPVAYDSTGPLADFDIMTIGLLVVIKDTDYGKYDKDIPAQAALLEKIEYAQKILATLRGLLIEYETLHWDLMTGSASKGLKPDLDKNGMPIPSIWDDVVDNWYPEREVADPGSIVLLVGQDEFKVRYEHIENLVNKLDTLVSSQFIKELLGNKYLDILGGLWAEEPAPKTATSPALSESGTSNGLASATGGIGKFHVPNLNGDILMRLGEMRYSYEECVIEDPNTGVKIILPPLDTQIDTERWADEQASVYAFRRWIQAYRADVLMYLLHFIFEAINTAETEGAEFLLWLLKALLGEPEPCCDGTCTDCQCTDCDKKDPGQCCYDPGQPPCCDGTCDPCGCVGCNRTAPGQCCWKPAAPELAIFDAVSALINYQIGQLDLQAAVEPFLTEMLGNMVSGFLYDDMLPNTILGLYPMLAKAVLPILTQPLADLVGLDDGPLIGDGTGFFGFLSFFTFDFLFSALGFGNVEQFLSSSLGKSVLQIAGLKTDGSAGVVDLLEIIIGAQLLPGDIIDNCWPDDWPTRGVGANGLPGDGAIKSGTAPYAEIIENELIFVYDWFRGALDEDGVHVDSSGKPSIFDRPAPSHEPPNKAHKTRCDTTDVLNMGVKDLCGCPVAPSAYEESSSTQRRTTYATGGRYSIPDVRSDGFGGYGWDLPLGIGDISTIIGEAAGSWVTLSGGLKFNYNQLYAWQFIDASKDMQFHWGLEKLVEPVTNGQITREQRELQRIALEDIMAFSMSSISMLLSAVFGDGGLNVNIGEAGMNTNAKKNATWRIELDLFKDFLPLLVNMLTGLIMGVIEGFAGWVFNLPLIGGGLRSLVNSIVSGLLNAVVNGILGLLPDISLPLHNWLGDDNYDGDSSADPGKFMPSWPHWKGRYDSRAGVFVELTPVNAYGRIIVPLFEMLNIDPKLFGNNIGGPTNGVLNDAYFQARGISDPQARAEILAGGSYTEKSFNRLMRAYGGDITKIVLALNGSTTWTDSSGVSRTITRDQGKATLQELSRIMMQAVFEPILNWIEPVHDLSLIPHSIGFRPVGKVLDLLPNLAFVIENGRIPKLVNQVLDELLLTVEICFGGMNAGDIVHIIYDPNTKTGLIYQLFDAILNPIIDIVKNAVNIKFELGPIEIDLGELLGGILSNLKNMLVDFLLGSIFGVVFQATGFLDTWFANKDRVPPRSDIGSLLGFFAGDSLPSKLNISIYNKASVKDEFLGSLLSAPGTNQKDSNGNKAPSISCQAAHLAGEDNDKPNPCKANPAEIHADGLFGYLEHMIGLDLTTQHLNELIQGVLGLIGIEDQTEPTTELDPKLYPIIDKVVEKRLHVEGFLIELFNPQTYPNKTFMVYPMIGTIPPSGSSLPLNQVNYSDIWTRAKAQFLNDNLMEMLDKWWDFLFAEPFLPWLWNMVNDLLGFDITNLYTQANFDSILNMISGLLANLDIKKLLSTDILKKLMQLADSDAATGDITDNFELINKLQKLANVEGLLFTLYVLKYYNDPAGLAAMNPQEPLVVAEVARLQGLGISDREAFTKAIYGLLAPLAPILRIFLTGGRTTDEKGKLIDTLWYGELYPNNGAKDAGYYHPGTKDFAKDYVWNTQRYLTVKGFSVPEAEADGFTTAGNNNYTPGIVLGNQWDYKSRKMVSYKNADGTYEVDGDIYATYGGRETFRTIGAKGDNLTLLEDYLGFSGYDGYRQGLIPIYEHLGVPAEDIPSFAHFVLNATEGGNGYTGNELFFKMLVDPLLNLVDRVVEDPINTVIGILPNLLYFITAEATDADLAYADKKYGNNNGIYGENASEKVLGGTTLLNESINRLLRPIYAIVDMLGPLYTVPEILEELLPVFMDPVPEIIAGGLPIVLNLGGIELKINIPTDISLNQLVTDLLGGLNIAGLQINLTDLTTLITGVLEIYKSQNGQDDAVRIQGSGDLPDLLTNLIRQLIEIIFTENNYPVIVELVKGLGVPDFLLPTLLQLLENIYGLMSDRTLRGHIGTDLVLSMLFYVLYDANSLADDLLLQRDLYGARIASFFEIIAGSSSPTLARYAERSRKFLNRFYGTIMTPDSGVQRKGFVKFISDFWAKIVAFFRGIGNWFMRIIRWMFPFFF